MHPRTYVLIFSCKQHRTDNSSTIPHQSQPQRGPVRVRGLIAAHQSVSWKCILNGTHGRVAFTAATFSPTWLQILIFNLKISSVVVTMREGGLLVTSRSVDTLEKRPSENYHLKSRWRPTGDVLHHVASRSSYQATAARYHYRMLYRYTQSPSPYNPSLSYRLHFYAAFGCYRPTVSHRLSTCNPLVA